LNLVNSAYNLTNYRLNNVQWELIKNDEVANNEIIILEKLLDKKPIEDPKAATGYEPL
jgi:hypothetical protein